MNSEKKKVILHCGVHKTGSSYLQAFFSKNSDILERYGVHYPSFKNPDNPYLGNHSVIAINYQNETDIFGFLSKRLNIESSKPVLLISGEEFSRQTILPSFLKNLKNSNEVDEVKVIFYLRRFDHLLESVYSESVKLGLTGGFEKASYELDYRKTIQPAIDTVGINNIIIRPYNKDLWYKGVLGADFLNSIGIGIAYDSMAFGANDALNSSMSRTHTFILSCLQDKDSKREMLNFFKTTPLYSQDSSKYFMSPARRNELNQNHLSECNAFFSQFGITDLAAFLGIERNIQELSWTKFTPDIKLIKEYIEKFYKAGGSIDMNSFMAEATTRVIS